MPEFSDLEKLNEPAGIANSIGFWIYNIQNDIIKLSTNSMENFGIKTEVPLDLVSFKSHILGVDNGSHPYLWFTGNLQHLVPHAQSRTHHWVGSVSTYPL